MKDFSPVIRKYALALLAWIERMVFKEPAEAVMDETNQTTDTTVTSTAANVPPNDTMVPWTGKENCRHNVRVLCDLEGLTEQQKDDLSSTVNCESGYNPACIHPNIVNGKVASTDYGICAINDFWHIGEGKDFISTEYVLANPAECIKWMISQWKSGNGRLWVCWLKNLSENYSS